MKAPHRFAATKRVVVHVWSQHYGGSNDAVLAGMGGGSQYGLAVATDPTATSGNLDAFVVKLAP